MNAEKKEELLDEMKEWFENSPVSELKKAHFVIGLMVVLFDRRTIILINIAITLGIGIGLNAINPNPWIILISLFVNMMGVRFLLFGLLLKGMDEEQAEFKVQFSYVKELLEERRTNL
jgi:hypothetical protein